jgi:site-specific DNA-methyltransferase (adenine-specific)
VSTIGTDDFMSLTLDVWSIPSESARRIGHPAPFPVELPEQLIRLYTFEDDLVVDPFMGSGSSLVAAARTGRRFIGYDLDPSYVDMARRRVEDALAGAAATVPPGPGSAPAKELAERMLVDAGFVVTGRNERMPRTGVRVDLVAIDASGARWLFEVAGPARAHRGGMLQTDVVWRTLGRAHAVREARGATPFVVLTTAVPRRPGEGDTVLRAAGPAACFDVIEVGSLDDAERLRRYAKGGADAEPLPGFWTSSDLARLRTGSSAS